MYGPLGSADITNKTIIRIDIVNSGTISVYNPVVNMIP